MKSIHERVRAELARQDKARKAAEYKAGEAARRSAAGRLAADVKRDIRIDGLVAGTIEPRSQADWDILDRLHFGE